MCLFRTFLLENLDLSYKSKIQRFPIRREKTSFPKLQNNPHCPEQFLYGGIRITHQASNFLAY